MSMRLYEHLCIYLQIAKPSLGQQNKLKFYLDSILQLFLYKITNLIL